MLCAIRDRAKETEDEELVAEINNTILVNPYKKGLDYYKLQPTQIDREVFHKLIRSESEIHSSGVMECYSFFLKKIRQNLANIYKIHKIICNNLSIVSVVLSTDDDPYLVFESLNAKGRALTQADLIRNYFFMRIHSDKQESIYKQYWEPMETLLGTGLTEFIRHYLTKDTVDVKQNEIYLQIKEKIKQDDALPYLQDLHKFADYYSRLLNPELENNLKIRKYLKRIDRLEVATVYPFLLNCYEEWIQNRISEDEFVVVFQTLENFILRRFVCDVQTRGLNRIFALLHSQIIKDPNATSNSFVERTKTILQSKDYPKDSLFKERLLDVKLYGSNRTEKAKLILESLEESFKHKEKVDLAKVSIEHIMPQTLNACWKEHLGEDWAITYDLFVHSLGNLTLTAYNSELSNYDFVSKRNEYKKSHLELNKYFEQCEEWKRENIEIRAEYLASRIIEIWKYFGDESLETTESNGLTGKIPRMLVMLGEEYPVKSWRDVLEITMNTISEVEPEHFKEIMYQFPRLVGSDERSFRSTRKLKNGAFIETNLSAKYIYSLCLRSVEITEFSIQDWYVETVKS